MYVCMYGMCSLRNGWYTNPLCGSACGTTNQVNLTSALNFHIKF